MHLNKFDLNLLIALDALLHERNVTRAAERLFVSQPAMSAALQRLREYFGDSLLVRVGREMDLTPKGMSLIEPVREALLHIQLTLGTQPSFDVATVQRRFSVAAIDYAVPRLIPGVLARMLQEAPRVQLAVEELSQASMGRLEHGDCDLLVLVDSPQSFGLRAFPEWLRIAELMPVRWVCIAWKDNPRIGAELTQEDYVKLPHLVARPQGSNAPLPELTHHLSPTDLDVRATARSYLELPFMLVGTSLIATVPENVALRFAAALPIRVFEPPRPVPDSREIMAWHKRQEPDPGHAWLRSLFLAGARSL